MLCSLFMRLIVTDLMSPNIVSVSDLSALLTPTYDNLASANKVKWHQLDSLCMIISNIFSNLQCDKNNDLFSEKERATRDRYFNIVCSSTYSRTLNALASKMHRSKMVEQVLFWWKNSHFVAFLVASDDGITIVTAETNLGNILETRGHTIPRGKCVLSSQLMI